MLRMKVIKNNESTEDEIEEAQFRLATIGMKIKKMQQAERKLRDRRWHEELAAAWRDYNISKSWRVTRRIARSHS